VRAWLLGPLLVALVTGALVAGLVIVFTRNNEAPAPSLRDVLAAQDPGPIHVHGLGINPADGALVIATHTGTYRVASDETEAKLIGDSRQDTMGFSVAGPNYFLGSGHPDPNEARERSIPPLLGLIQSRDAGRTWQPISLYGEADFHVLRFTGTRVYAYDASHDRLLVSGDAGQTWRRLERPAPLIDLAVDPSSPKRVIASTESGLFQSGSEGRTWRPLGRQVGLLAWPSSKRLFLVDGSGRVLTSSDSARRWTTIGDIEGRPAAILAPSATELYVALHDGTIKRSRDGGRSWRIRSTP
jgi:hypothetical protein